VALGLGASLVLAAISQGSRWGWTSPTLLGCLAIGAASLVWFVHVERTVGDPMVQLAWFRTPTIAWPVASQGLGNVAYMGSFILAPQVL
jgi:hypothetical protein